MPPPHSVRTPTPGDPGFGNAADSRRHVPLPLLLLVARFPHSSCSRKFSFNPPPPPLASPPTWSRELGSWEAPSPAGPAASPLRKALICTLACHCAASPQPGRPVGLGRVGLPGLRPRPRPRHLPSLGPELRPEPHGSRPPPASRAGGALRRPSALRRCAHPLAERELVTPSSEPVTCSAPPRTRAEVALTPAALSEGRPWPGRSGEDLGARVGGLRGGGRGTPRGKIWALG